LRKLLPAFGLALLASLVLSALGVASASAANQYWYSCMKTKATESSCPVPWSKVNESRSFSMKSTSSFVISIRVFTTNRTVSCSSQAAKSGNLYNGPAAGYADISEGEGFKLSGCYDVGTPACAVSAEGFYVHGESTEMEGKPAIKFVPKSGKILFTLTFYDAAGKKCPEALKGVKPIEGGGFVGISNGSTSSLEFTATGGSLKYGGWPVTIVGTSKIGLGTPEPSELSMVKLAP
jgi:hypothetical protein